MPQARSRPGAVSRWVAPVLLLGIAGGLAPLWWDSAAPPLIVTARPWRDAQGALVVPAAAVRRAAQGGVGTVFVIERGVARATAVRLGAIGREVIEIAGGLSEQAEIAAAPPRTLEDRHRVVPALREAAIR